MKRLHLFAWYIHPLPNSVISTYVLARATIMLRPSVLMLVGACVVFTVYTNHYADYHVRKGESIRAYEDRRLCSPFFKCHLVDEHGNRLVHDDHYNASMYVYDLYERCAAPKPPPACSGSIRCCTDCEHAVYIYGRPDRETPPNKVQLEDDAGRVHLVVGISTLGVVVVYLTVLVLSTKRVGRKARNLVKLRALVGALLVLDYVALVCITAYTTFYTVVNGAQLLRCQLDFISLIMWSWTMQLCTLDFLRNVMFVRMSSATTNNDYKRLPESSDSSSEDTANTTATKWRHRNIRRRYHLVPGGAAKRRPGWLKPVTRLVVWLARLTFFTWIAIALYIAGVGRRWWRPISTWDTKAFGAWHGL